VVHIVVVWPIKLLWTGEMYGVGIGVGRVEPL